MSSVVPDEPPGHGGRHDVSGGGTMRTTRVVICIRPSAHTGQRATSRPVSRCISPATDSGGTSSGGGLTEEVAAPSARGAPRPIREPPEMSDAHEAARHDVQEKTSQAFIGVQRHDLHAVVVGIVLPAEPDDTVAVIDQPIIRQRDAMGVPTEVVEHLLGTGEGPLRIHDPVDGSQLAEETGEGAPVGQICRATREGQLAGIERALPPGQVLRTKDR